MIPGLYHFLYRKYNPVQGRWISPDPGGLGAVDPSNPQSWNRYAYVANRTPSSVDALGLVTIECSFGGCFGGGGSTCDPTDPNCIGGCDYFFDPFCDPSGGGGGGGSSGSGSPPPSGSNPQGPPQRTGGRWPGNVTPGLPGGLNQTPLSLASSFGLSPGTQCGDFIDCGSLWADGFTSSPSSADPLGLGSFIGLVVEVAVLAREIKDFFYPSVTPVCMGLVAQANKCLADAAGCISGAASGPIIDNGQLGPSGQIGAAACIAQEYKCLRKAQVDNPQCPQSVHLP
jgi:RHS repeat-associated protein